MTVVLRTITLPILPIFIHSQTLFYCRVYTINCFSSRPKMLSRATDPTITHTCCLHWRSILIVFPSLAFCCCRFAAFYNSFLLLLYILCWCVSVYVLFLFSDFPICIMFVFIFIGLWKWERASMYICVQNSFQNIIFHLLFPNWHSKSS